MNNLNEQDLDRFQKWLRSHLKMGPMTITFTKVNGDERVMKCTTDPTYIMFKDPAVLESKLDRKQSKDVISVYDLENNAWKSFRWDSVKQVRFEL
jgi:hypothetical protein